MAKIFVSYRRDDSAYVAAAIKEKLEQKFGADSVFFDIDTIPLGTDFRKHVFDAVGKCDVLLAIVGNKWLDAVDDQGKRRLDDPDDTVRLEIESALERDIPVIPVLVSGARIPSTSDLPLSLQDLVFRNAAEVRPGPDLQHDLVRLVEGLETLHSPDRIRCKDCQRTSWRRWVFSAIALLSSFVTGIVVGNLIYPISSRDVAQAGAAAIWLAGIIVTYWVFKRNWDA